MTNACISFVNSGSTWALFVPDRKTESKIFIGLSKNWRKTYLFASQILHTQNERNVDNISDITESRDARVSSA